jgi:hypothetical protein
MKVDLSLNLLPEGCRDGDILGICIKKDKMETKDAKKRVPDLIEKLKSRGKDDLGPIQDSKNRI